MPDSAHINLSSENTLQSKADDYRKASKAHSDIESSIKHADQDNDWAQKLGSGQELQDAKRIIENSRIQAARSFSNEELQEAKEQELITHKEAKQVIAIKRKSEMKEREEKRSASNKHSASRKRSRSRKL